MRGKYVRTPEIREKLRLAAGHSLSPEIRERLRDWNLGRIRPAEFRGLMRKRTLGQVHTEETKELLRVLHLRDGNPNWKGGISQLPYPIEFDQDLKEQIRTRDHHQCRLCGIPQIELIRKLDVHHIDYVKQNLDPMNLISLCRGCNSTVNSNRDFWSEFLSLLVRVEV